MSFVLELEVPGLTWTQVDELVLAVADSEGWPVGAAPRRRWGREQAPALLLLDASGDRQLLSDDAEWDAEAWSMDRELLPRLATTLRLLCERLPQGFAFRATWTGSEVRVERRLSCDELVRLTLDSRLNEFTRYVVGAADAS